jgi:dihydrodipicolinate synthase/N-acetylneuraminate lyase
MRLADHPLICALKEAGTDLRQMNEDARLLSGRMAIYCGNDDYAFSWLALGADGAISVASNPGARGGEGRVRPVLCRGHRRQPRAADAARPAD